VTSALAERLDGGRYIDIAIDRVKAARYGVSVKELQSIVASVVGGDNIGETIEGRERYPISVRYPREMRDSLQKLRDLPVVTSGGAQVALRTGGYRHHRRPADAEKRKRPPVGLDLRGYSRARPEIRRGPDAA
jgi:multidrug efflux pump subunit AcrB